MSNGVNLWIFAHKQYKLYLFEGLKKVDR